MLSGGGLATVSFIGALESLGNVFSEFSGVSAGALLCMMLSCRVDLKLILEMLMVSRTQWAMSLWDSWRPTLDMNDAAPSEFLLGIAEQALSVCGFGKDATFADLQTRHGTVLNVYAVALADGRYTTFSGITTPSSSVAKAVAASMTIPFLFNPIDICGNKYIDGGLVCNFPIHMSEPSRTVGLKVAKDIPPPSSVAQALPWFLFARDCVRRRHLERICEKHGCRIVDCSPAVADVRALFWLSDLEFRERLEHGKSCVSRENLKGHIRLLLLLIPLLSRSWRAAAEPGEAERLSARPGGTSMT